MTELTRTYVCPVCGYDGFRMGEPRATIDVAVHPGCPQCMTNDGVLVLLTETSDPRELAARRPLSEPEDESTQGARLARADVPGTTRKTSGSESEAS